VQLDKIHARINYCLVVLYKLNRMVSPIQLVEFSVLTPIEHMQVDHRDFHTFMPLQVLHCAIVVSRYYQVSSKVVVERVRSDNYFK
jgi:hypothetical protein